MSGLTVLELVNSQLHSGWLASSLNVDSLRGIHSFPLPQQQGKSTPEGSTAQSEKDSAIEA